MAKKKKTVIPADETPAQRFKRVVEPRVGKALKAIRLVGSVSGSAYKCSDSHAAEIMAELQDALNKTGLQLLSKGVVSTGFKLT